MTTTAESNINKQTQHSVVAKMTNIPVVIWVLIAL